ncbi:hypothetical protein [Vibrio agarivorans]|uniref:DUF945 domain-containing protein n=1 Tax=Vibrio agarivorans TaxID=153622 RepID=A0ABT7Y7D1_9VIBR|nr:hypothetical protein [Vibrio agarivorans]MDN2483903.1 hypothetical protein [Vibrio agarivorans]
MNVKSKTAICSALCGTVVLSGFQLYNHILYQHQRDSLLSSADYLQLISVEQRLTGISEVYTLEGHDGSQVLTHDVDIMPFRMSGLLKSESEPSRLTWRSLFGEFSANGAFHSIATPNMSISNVIVSTEPTNDGAVLDITANSVTIENDVSKLAFSMPVLKAHGIKSSDFAGGKFAVSVDSIEYQASDTEWVSTDFDFTGHLSSDLVVGSARAKVGQLKVWSDDGRTHTFNPVKFTVDAENLDGNHFFAPFRYALYGERVDLSRVGIDGSVVSMQLVVGDVLDAKAKVSALDRRHGNIQLDLDGNHQLPLIISSFSGHLLDRFAEARGAGYVQHDSVKGRFYSNLLLQNDMGQWSVK